LTDLSASYITGRSAAVVGSRYGVLLIYIYKFK